MPRTYNKNFKAMIVNLICVEKHSTIKIAEQFDVPLKTIEKWVTAYNKDNHCFDPIIETITDFKIINDSNNLNYDDLDSDELKDILMKKDIEIARLKKAYTVKGGGTERKVYITFSKKNTK